MRVLYADASAVARAYLAYEEGHAASRRMLLDRADIVVTSELTRLEFTSAILRAAKGRRRVRPAALLRRFSEDSGEEGPINVVRFAGGETLLTAQKLVARHLIRALDALHLATALEGLTPWRDFGPVVFATYDAEQAAAAMAEGLALADESAG